jgi:two-component system NtrC family response regulator
VKILIIDDEMAILTLVKDMLESIGHTVEIAIDGEMGLEKFAGGKFDLILMDYRMHGIDGIEVSKRMVNKVKNIKILFISADSSVEEKSLEIGAFGFLLKPFDIDDLLEIVEKIDNE